MDVVEPHGDLEIIPDKTELYNRVKYTPIDGVERTYPAEGETSASIIEYGESLFTAPSRLLSSSLEANEWARWFLTVYSQPRVAVRSIKLAPYFTSPDTARLIHQLSIGKSVRIINQ